MVKEITNTIIDILKRFKGVNHVAYKGDDLINQQQNYKPLQCYIDTIQMHQFNLTNNICKVEYNIYILGFPQDGTEEATLEVQDKCFDVAAYTLAAIDQYPQYKGILRLYDYSIMTLDRFSEQSNCGVRLSVVLEYPLNICDLDAHFNDEPYEEDKDKEIDIDEKEVGELDIKPIKLPKNRNC